MALDISTFVDITTQVAAGGVPLERFGRGLLITTDDAISAGGSGKVQLYTTLNGFSGDFDAGDAMDAASVWFSADPIPQGLWVGRWADTDADTSLTGDAPGPVADFTAANYSFAINGMNVTGIDVSGGAIDTYAEYATAIQTELRMVSAFAGATVTYAAADAAFVIELVGATAISPPYLTPALTAGVQVGTDIVSLMGMGQSDDVKYRQGHDAESVADAAAEMVGFATSGAPVAIMLADDAPETDPVAGGDTRENLAAWASAGDYVFFQLDTADQALVATDDDLGILSLAFSRNQGQVAATYSRAGEKPDVGLGRVPIGAAFGQCRQHRHGARQGAARRCRDGHHADAIRRTEPQAGERRYQRGRAVVFGRRVHLPPRLLVGCNVVAAVDEKPHG